MQSQRRGGGLQALPGESQEGVLGEKRPEGLVLNGFAGVSSLFVAPSLLYDVCLHAQCPRTSCPLSESGDAAALHQEGKAGVWGIPKP